MHNKKKKNHFDTDIALPRGQSFAQMLNQLMRIQAANNRKAESSFYLIYPIYSKISKLIAKYIGTLFLCDFIVISKNLFP